MPDAYHSGCNPARGPDLLTGPVAVKVLGHQPQSPAALWELFAGAGGPSKEARGSRTDHLPPIDYRWGYHVGQVSDQRAVVYALILYGCSLLVAAPSCRPWGCAFARVARWGDEPAHATEGVLCFSSCARSPSCNSSWGVASSTRAPQAQAFQR